ncbi:MAG: hypothetical protein WAU37_08670 [Formosimonas sp.]|jgi:hypothetical protein
MKRLIQLLMVLATAVLLTACGVSDKKSFTQLQTVVVETNTKMMATQADVMKKASAGDLSSLASMGPELDQFMTGQLAKVEAIDATDKTRDLKEKMVAFFKYEQDMARTVFPKFAKITKDMSPTEINKIIGEVKGEMDMEQKLLQSVNTANQAALKLIQ